MRDYDGPTLLFAREQPIKAGRKVHTCWACHMAIEVGQPKVKVVMMTSDDAKPEVSYRCWRHRFFDGLDDEES